jgi:hypothetical protein
MENGHINYVNHALLPLPFETLKEQLRERANPVPAVPEALL